MITRLKSLIKKVVFKLLKVQTKVVYNTYAQSGEDVIMKFIFDQKGVNKPTYLELGVCNPDHNNNTYLFYLNGSRGVCVEADETFIPAIKSLRNEDVVLNIGVGDGSTNEADFFIFNEKGLNTFDKDEVDLRLEKGTFKIDKIVKIPFKTVNEIIKENFSGYPDLLSIDIEGLDLAVLKSLNYKEFPIPVICAETCCYSETHIRPKNKLIEEFMLTVGYEVYADTYINTIFVNKKWFEKVN